MAREEFQAVPVSTEEEDDEDETADARWRGKSVGRKISRFTLLLCGAGVCFYIGMQYGRANARAKSSSALDDQEEDIKTMFADRPREVPARDADESTFSTITWAHPEYQHQPRSEMDLIKQTMEGSMATAERSPAEMPKWFKDDLHKMQTGSLFCPAGRTPVYTIKKKLDIPVDGFAHCKLPNLANVYYPEFTNGSWKKVPYISWAHGWTQGGVHLDTCKFNEGMYRPIVEQGYLIVAHQTGGVDDYCDSSHDQIRMLEWVHTSEFAERIDASVGLVGGYSMGGRATLRVASYPSVVKKFNIKAAFVVNPHCVTINLAAVATSRHRTQFGHCLQSTVPTFFSAGSKDNCATDWIVHRTYLRTHGVPRYFAKYSVHHIVEKWEGYWMLSAPIVKFLDCYAKNVTNACERLKNLKNDSRGQLWQLEQFETWSVP